jgi:methyl coenzyme M reductase gamma subunit
MLTIILSKYVQTQLQAKVGLLETNKSIHSTLSSFEFTATTVEDMTESHEFLEQSKKIYTIKYTDTHYNALEGQEYFNSYEHLYKALKKYSRNIKRTSETV